MRDYLKRLLESLAGSRSVPTQSKFAPRGISHTPPHKEVKWSRLRASKLEAHTAGQSVNDMHSGLGCYMGSLKHRRNWGLYIRLFFLYWCLVFAFEFLSGRFCLQVVL